MPEKRIIVIDSQRLNTIQACMRKYLYAFGKSFEPIEVPIQFERGDLIHAALEFYYNARRVRHAWADNGLDHGKVVEQVIDHTRKRALDKKIEIEEVEEVIRTLHEYLTHYHNDGWDTILSIEKVGSKVMYEDDNLVIVYEGKIDLVIGLSNYPAIPVDHKSEKRKNFTSDMANQFMGYCWLMDVNNIIVNKIGLQKTVKPAEKFSRPVLSYTPERIEEWKQNAIFTIRQAVSYIDADVYPMNLTSCDKYAGCTFRSICSKSPEDREFALHQLYQIREKVWDVGASND